jgi:hypothetical protein
MSISLHKSKPNLIDLKLLKSYNNKIKNKYTIPANATEPNAKENYLWENIIYFKNFILNILIFFIKEYYGIIIFIILLIILLYIRYIEVNKRKAKLQKILFKD